jgi:hypothetical protein
MAYAESTTVPVEKSIGEIIALIKRSGANRIAQMEEPGRLAMQFFLNEKLLRFTVTMPGADDVKKTDRHGYALSAEQMFKRIQQAQRQRARALLLVIKAKLESVESGVETFEEAFLSNIVTPDGATVGQWLIPQLEEGYRIGKMPTQLLLTDGSA